VIESELGKPVSQIFRAIDTEPIAAASLAQVYTATLFTGEKVVVKVQRPGIEEVVNTDLDIMFDLAKTAQEHTEIGYRHEVSELAQEFAYGLRGELDFRREAATPHSSAKTSKTSLTCMCRKSIWSTPPAGDGLRTAARH